MNPPGLKKNKPVAFKRPQSTMFKVYQSIQEGNHSILKICVDTRLVEGKVKSAIWNLAYVGMIHREREGGVTRYFIGTEDCRKVYKTPATNFIFNPHKN